MTRPGFDADSVAEANHFTLLERINRDLPPGIDWKAGAKRYLRQRLSVFDAFAHNSMTKPMWCLQPGPQGLRELDQAVAYLSNFTNLIKLLRLPAGSRIMDVACGAGWMSHYFTKLGYTAFGFDIAADFIALAKRRILEDPNLAVTPDQAEAMFVALDIEAEGPGDAHLGSYDAIVLESCFHHFFDPIAALRNVAPCLSESGVVVLFEGENRIGEIKEFYMDVMVEYHTMERPYERALLIEILKAAGLPHFEFLGQVNGLFSPKDPIFGNATERLAETERAMNICVCAANRTAIDRILPYIPAQAAIAPEPRTTMLEVEYLRKREAELVDLLNAITSSKGFRALEFIRRLVGR